jgi:hypothetical protein
MFELTSKGHGVGRMLDLAGLKRPASISWNGHKVYDL